MCHFQGTIENSWLLQVLKLFHSDLNDEIQCSYHSLHDAVPTTPTLRSVYSSQVILLLYNLLLLWRECPKIWRKWPRWCHRGYLGLGLDTPNFNRKLELHTGGMIFQKPGPLPVRESWMKNAIKLHHGKCRTQHFLSQKKPKSQDTPTSSASILIILLLISCKSL